MRHPPSTLRPHTLQFCAHQFNQLLTPNTENKLTTAHLEIIFFSYGLNDEV